MTNEGAATPGNGPHRGKGKHGVADKGSHKMGKKWNPKKSDDTTPKKKKH